AASRMPLEMQVVRRAGVAGAPDVADHGPGADAAARAAVAREVRVERVTARAVDVGLEAAGGAGRVRDGPGMGRDDRGPERRDHVDPLMRVTVPRPAERVDE